MNAVRRTFGQAMKRTTDAATSTTRRGIIQVACALLLAGSVSAALLPSAGASDNEPGLEMGYLWCTTIGGEWIEWTGDNGWVMKTSCVLPDGTVYNCDANGEWCKPAPAGSPPPIKDIPAGGGQVGDDLGLSPDSSQTVPAVDSATPDDDHGASTDKKSKKSKKHKKHGKVGKGRRK